MKQFLRERRQPIQRFIGAVIVALVILAGWYYFGPRTVETLTEQMTFRIESNRVVFEGSNREYFSTRSNLVEFVRHAPTNRAIVSIRLNRLSGTPVASYRIVDVDLAQFVPVAATNQGALRQ